MQLKKLGAFAVALLLVFGLASLALAQAPNAADDNGVAAGTAMGGLMAFWCGCIAAAALIGIAIKIAIMIFIYKDAQARGADPMLWLILALFVDLIALIIWLIVRPPLREPPMGEPPV